MSLKDKYADLLKLGEELKLGEQQGGRKKAAS